MSFLAVVVLLTVFVTIERISANPLIPAAAEASAAQKVSVRD
ncbi:hypothetical protein P6B95_07475 [Streptomyces atratus]|nr:hypothetical protein [Streptomyces atratus]WPW27250.1 hypothetical protein P6B95_07475 [Streptomyces atratus]